jgi:hypothetical protein
MSELFFPTLVRRDAYSRRRDGQYYEYRHYKQEIREDCLGRCVYCDSHENEVGGQECMELDHFRPKKFDEYKHLINDPSNLVWTCRGCNRLKSDVWPTLGSEVLVVDGQGFIDPFNETRADYFELLPSGELIPLKEPAYYLIYILSLNRISRTRLREQRLWVQSFIADIEQSITNMEIIIEGGLSRVQLRAAEDVLRTLEDMKDQLVSKLFDFRLL